MKEPFNVIELGNGIRLVHRQMRHTRIVHVGLMVDAGSRDENPHNNGIAHFIEHSVFKGTHKRKAYHILNRLEAVGGELNAYTTREKTVFYASCLKRYTERAIDLLTDITFNSVFEPKEVEKEKKVVLEEIEMYEDIPEDSIHDEFYQMLYPDHSLGYDILGTRETVPAFMREHIREFMQQHYAPRNIVLSVVGNINLNRAEQLAHRYLGHLEPREQPRQRHEPQTKQFRQYLKKDLTQTHCIIGREAYSKQDPRRYALVLLNNILGGAGMSSRLNMVVREKWGFTYNIQSSYSAFTDSGAFHIYFGTDKEHLEKSIQLTFRELRRLREEKLGVRQLQKAKNQVLGHVAMMEENHSVTMQSQAKSLLDYNRVITLDEFFQRMDALTAEEVQEVANDLLQEDQMSVLVYEEGE